MIWVLVIFSLYLPEGQVKENDMYASVFMTQEKCEAMLSFVARTVDKPFNAKCLSMANSRVSNPRRG